MAEPQPPANQPISVHRFTPFMFRGVWPLIAIAVIYIILHLTVVTYGNVLISDERYYVPEARSILEDRELLDPVHPSLAKLFVTAGIFLFGDNPWGWRLFPLVFGLLAVLCFYLLCIELAGRRTAFVASFLFICENLIFLHMGLAMLDVFSFSFMLLSFLFYIRGKYILSGAALALAMLCKMTGLFGLIAILAHWLIARREGAGVLNVVNLVAAVAITFLLLMPLADFLATGEYMNPFQRVDDMLWATASGQTGDVPESMVPYLRYPWEWILNPAGHSLAPDLHYYDQITPTLWVMILPSLLYMACIWQSRKSRVGLFALLWFIAVYFPWVAITILSDRPMYLFYFFPALAAVTLAVGYAVQRIWVVSGKARRLPVKWLPRVATLIYLGVHLFLFYAFSPLIAVLTPSWLPPPST